ncbi:Tyrosine recombinase XerC [Candidatus Izimaplasma bacterium HR1]|jgi:site-specific recombinase XerD|uniref:tyrosine-type recombinase/integrase n=1 Tax=Candidatus Izimoplasma sp. HR1 TaxID=1541959 RepID=UPI0004F80A06|nr:Tyrosine recombinase XerC [Candidatus Izimaplasma bacterium HR1]AIO18829.1 Tyrosine recombinase XerC [Candidatus Izimaplasma bacterium HR1]
MNDLNRIVELLTKETNKTITIDNLIHLFLKNSKYTKRLGTYDYESKHLEIVCRYLDSRKIYMTKDITLSVMYDFIELQKLKGISNNTINKRIGLLKQCLNFSVRNNFISDNPIQGITMLRVRKRETITIPRYIILDILYYLDHLKPTPLNLRNKAIVYLLLDTGMRLSELVHLKIENLNLSENTINLTYTKTSEDRTVFISQKTSEILEEYLKLLNRKYGLLIIEFRTEGKIYPRYVNHLLSDIAKTLNINQSISPHKWRHTYATMCLQNGANLEFVRKTLGHSNLQTTQKYLHLERENLSKQHNAYSPLTKL